MLTPKQMTVVWRCPECGREVKWSYLDLVNRGEPICGFDDEEMEMVDPNEEEERA